MAHFKHQQNYLINCTLLWPNQFAILPSSCLTPDKKADTYELIFNTVKETAGKTQTDFIIDFELGSKKALETIFSSTKITGCYFHLVYSIRKQLILKGGLTDLNRNPIFRLAFSKIKCLAFMPIEQIRNAYHKIVKPALFNGT